MKKRYNTVHLLASIILTYNSNTNSSAGQNNMVHAKWPDDLIRVLNIDTQTLARYTVHACAFILINYSNATTSGGGVSRCLVQAKWSDDLLCASNTGEQMKTNYGSNTSTLTAMSAHLHGI